MTRRAIYVVACLMLAMTLLPLAAAQSVPTLGRLFSVAFADENVALGLAEVTGTDEVQVVKTQDGGVTWKLRYTFRRETVSEIGTGAGGRIGVILAGSGFYRSTDGGVRWNKSRLAQEPSKLQFDGVRGYMVGTPPDRGEVGPTLFVTASKGLRWDPRVPQPASVQDYCFASDTLGWVIDDRGLHQTTDGGRTFSLKKEIERSLLVGCHGDTHVWVLVDGRVVQSFDAGATWFEHEVGSRAVFTRMQFVTTSNGWLYSDTELRMTRDGGNKWWQLMRAPGPPTFWDAQRGWALGGNGDLFKTTNSGCTWARIAPSLTE